MTQPYFRWRNVQYERANSRQKSAYFFSAQHKAAVISPGMLNSFSGASLSSPPSFPRLAHMLHAFTPLPSFSSRIERLPQQAHAAGPQREAAQMQRSSSAQHSNCVTLCKKTPRKPRVITTRVASCSSLSPVACSLGRDRCLRAYLRFDPFWPLLGKEEETDAGSDGIAGCCSPRDSLVPTHFRFPLLLLVPLSCS